MLIRDDFFPFPFPPFEEYRGISIRSVPLSTNERRRREIASSRKRRRKVRPCQLVCSSRSLPGYAPRAPTLGRRRRLEIVSGDIARVYLWTRLSIHTPELPILDSRSCRRLASFYWLGLPACPSVCLSLGCWPPRGFRRRDKLRSSASRLRFLSSREGEGEDKEERESWETTPSLARVFSPLTVQPSSLQRDVPSRRGRRSLARSALPTRDTAELTRNITTPVRLIMRLLSTAYPLPFSGKEKLLKFSPSAGGKIEIEGNSFFDFLNFSYQEKFKGIGRRRAICPTPCE